MKVNSKSRTKKILAATWIIPMIVTTPYLYCRSQASTVGSSFGIISRQYCADRFNELDGNTGTFRRCFFIVIFVTMYFVPMSIIIVTCSRIAKCLLQPIIIEQSPAGIRDNKRRSEVNKRKVARMVIVVAVAFIIAWSPQFCVSIITQLQKESFLFKGNFFFTMLMTHLFGFINSCVNPFIYTAMSEKFRKSFRRTLKRLFCTMFYCRRRYLSRSSLLQRRATALTSASRSYLDPEEEPLQRRRQKSHMSTRQSSSSDCDSSIKSGHRVLYSVHRGSLVIDKYLAKDQNRACEERILKHDIRSDSDYVSGEKVLCGNNEVNLEEEMPTANSNREQRGDGARSSDQSYGMFVQQRVRFSSDDQVINRFDDMY